MALGVPSVIPSTDDREWRKCSLAFHGGVWQEDKNEQNC